MGIKLKEAKLATGEHYAWMFRCPGCDDLHVLTTWTWNGSLEVPTFTPSVLVRYYDEDGKTERERCHSFVTDGKIQYLSDCTHTLAGQTIELPDW